MLKVLIVEDDLVSADVTQMVLTSYGYDVCGIACSVAEAVALGWRHMPDFAVIDLRLAGGGLGTEVAFHLSDHDGPGILYVTGDVAQLMSSAREGHACLAKPCRINDLLRGLEIVAHMVATGIAKPPFPPGFHVLKTLPVVRPIC